LEGRSHKEQRTSPCLGEEREKSLPWNRTQEKGREKFGDDVGDVKQEEKRRAIEILLAVSISASPQTRLKDGLQGDRKKDAGQACGKD